VLANQEELLEEQELTIRHLDFESSHRHAAVSMNTHSTSLSKACSSICTQAFVTHAYLYICMNTSDIQTTDIHFQSLDQLEVRLLKRHEENHLFISRAANALTLGHFIIHACKGSRSDLCTVWQEEEECAIREHQERAEARVSRQEEQRQEGMRKRLIELQTDEICFLEGVEVCTRWEGGRHERDRQGEHLTCACV
jgi:hypothetical protein